MMFGHLRNAIQSWRSRTRQLVQQTANLRAASAANTRASDTVQSAIRNRHREADALRLVLSDTIARIAGDRA